jgi:hypothetical protein
VTPPSKPPSLSSGTITITMTGIVGDPGDISGAGGQVSDSEPAKR